MSPLEGKATVGGVWHLKVHTKQVPPHRKYRSSASCSMILHLSSIHPQTRYHHRYTIHTLSLEWSQILPWVIWLPSSLCRACGRILRHNKLTTSEVCTLHPNSLMCTGHSCRMETSSASQCPALLCPAAFLQGKYGQPPWSFVGHVTIY